MSAKGTQLTIDGQIYRILERCAEGGEAEIYRAEDERGAPFAFKHFKRKTSRGDREQRTRFLVERSRLLRDCCPAIKAPIGLTTLQGRLGHIAPWAGDETLANRLEGPGLSMTDGLVFAIAFVQAVDVLLHHGVVLGDASLTNIVAHGDRIGVVDLDNYQLTKAKNSASAFAGQPNYLAPEIRTAVARGEPPTISEWSDRFAVAVVLHELILCKHPAAGFDGDLDRFRLAMTSGQWPHDPDLPGPPSRDGVGGYPATILNQPLRALFRRAFSLKPDQRPSAAEWRAALVDALNGQCYLHACGQPLFVDPSQRQCPHCGRAFSFQLLRGWTAEAFSLDAPETKIGRAQLGNHPMVSGEHAVFRRRGPLLELVSVGLNPTYRRSGNAWCKLPHGRPVLVNAGERLKFAEVETIIAGG